MFCKYKNIGGKSNVELYEIGDDYISVIFKKTRFVYKYSYKSTGSVLHVENMKQLAKNGSGLLTYIMRHCKNGYER